MGTHPIFESDFDCLTDIFNMNQLIAKVGRIAGLVGGAAIVGNQLIYNVDAGCRAVIFDRFQGVKQDVYGEGTHFLIPLVQTPIIYDVKTNPKILRTSTVSKDMQTVNITLRILYRPISSELPRMYTEIGVDYDERVLPSITNEVLKSIVARYNAEELITKRYEVSQAVTNLLTVRAKQFGIVLDDVALTHLTFSNEFTASVEQKQIAEQQAEMAKFRVEQATQIKKANIIKAEGDALAAKLVSDAISESGEGLVEMRKLEASSEVAMQLSRNPRVTYIPSGKGS